MKAKSGSGCVKHQLQQSEVTGIELEQTVQNIHTSDNMFGSLFCLLSLWKQFGFVSSIYQL